MSGLPAGWESDYDGSRWFFRYKPTGLVQYTFPKPGDEFPEFPGFMHDFSPPPVLTPEERLESQQQVKRYSTTGYRNSSRRNNRGRPGDATSRAIGEQDDSDGDGGYIWQPESFMYLGPGSYNDVSPVGDEEDGLERKVSKDKDDGGKTGERRTATHKPSSGDIAKVSPLTSAGTTPQVGTSEPATKVSDGSSIRDKSVSAGPPQSGYAEDYIPVQSDLDRSHRDSPFREPTDPVATDATSKVQLTDVSVSHEVFIDDSGMSPETEIPMLDSHELPYELPGSSSFTARDRFLPRGSVAELPSESTARCPEEAHPAPVELPSNEDVFGGGGNGFRTMNQGGLVELDDTERKAAPEASEPPAKVVGSKKREEKAVKQIAAAGAPSKKQPGTNHELDDTAAPSTEKYRPWRATESTKKTEERPSSLIDGNVNIREARDDELGFGSNRQSFDGHNSSGAYRSSVPAALQPPEAPPKIPLDNKDTPAAANSHTTVLMHPLAPGSGSQHPLAFRAVDSTLEDLTQPGHLQHAPSVLKPARGREPSLSTQQKPPAPVPAVPQPPPQKRQALPYPSDSPIVRHLAVVNPSSPIPRSLAPRSGQAPSAGLPLRPGMPKIETTPDVLPSQQHTAKLDDSAKLLNEERIPPQTLGSEQSSSSQPASRERTQQSPTTPGKGSRNVEQIAKTGGAQSDSDDEPFITASFASRPRETSPPRPMQTQTALRADPRQDPRPGPSKSLPSLQQASSGNRETTGSSSNMTLVSSKTPDLPTEHRVSAETHQPTTVATEGQSPFFPVQNQPVPFNVFPRPLNIMRPSQPNTAQEKRGTSVESLARREQQQPVQATQTGTSAAKQLRHAPQLGERIQSAPPQQYTDNQPRGDQMHQYQQEQRTATATQVGLPLPLATRASAFQGTNTGALGHNPQIAKPQFSANALLHPQLAPHGLEPGPTQGPPTSNTMQQQSGPTYARPPQSIIMGLGQVQRGVPASPDQAQGPPTSNTMQQQSGLTHAQPPQPIIMGIGQVQRGVPPFPNKAAGSYRQPNVADRQPAGQWNMAGQTGLPFQQPVFPQQGGQDSDDPSDRESGWLAKLWKAPAPRRDSLYGDSTMSSKKLQKAPTQRAPVPTTAPPQMQGLPGPLPSGDGRLYMAPDWQQQAQKSQQLQSGMAPYQTSAPAFTQQVQSSEGLTQQHMHRVHVGGPYQPQPQQHQPQGTFEQTAGNLPPQASGGNLSVQPQNTANSGWSHKAGPTVDYSGGDWGDDWDGVR